MLDSDANNMLNKTMYMHEDSSYSYNKSFIDKKYIMSFKNPIKE